MKRILTVAFAGLAIVSSAHAQPAPSRQSQVETGLSPAVVFDGKVETFAIADRMARWNTPGVSVAVMENGRIVWARGYGVLEAGKPGAVTAETRFQAASISKPVAATRALQLVEQGRLSLDVDVNSVLRAWKLPDSPLTAGAPVTLRRLLSHTGGTTVHGFPGYAQGAALPTLVQVLGGTTPANTGPVVVDLKPGGTWRYSGGGYQIVQLMIEEAGRRSFAEQVTAGVLRPAGMAHSGYGPPSQGGFAYGHDGYGKVIPGGWHAYPEAAAAGLWTTPSDLLRFGHSLGRAWKGDRGQVLKPETAKMMLTPVMGGYGLGPGVEGEGRDLRISHGGSNEGYMAYWVSWPGRGAGVAVMTNGDQGNRVMMEIVRAVARVYDLPGYAPAAHATFALSSTALDARIGVWTAEYDGETIEFTAVRRGAGLDLETFRGTFGFTPVSATDMVSADTGARAVFAPGPDGVETLRVFGMALKKKS